MAYAQSAAHPKNMLLSAILILLIAFSGLALTYLFAEDEPFLWRLSAGNVIGAAIFGLVGFIIACLFGLYPASVLIALLISILPVFLLAKKDIKKRFRLDWEKAKGKMQRAEFKEGSVIFTIFIFFTIYLYGLSAATILIALLITLVILILWTFLRKWRKAKGKTQNTNFGIFWKFAYYFGIFLILWLFFERVMFETSRGIFTGGSQNLGDLPFHLGVIFGFSEGQNFPPQNPSFAGARFSYPFIADFLSASLVKIGVDVKNAMFALNVSWAFSLLVILERFVFKFTNNAKAGKIAPVLLFFSGGLGFLWFAKDYWQGTQGFFDFLWDLPHDYTIREAKFRWGNSLTTLFMTQRSLLLGMPLMLIVLQKIWKLFATESTEKDKPNIFPIPIFFVGLLAGMLPLIHAHSLMVLFIVSAFLFVLSFEKWREWIAFGIGVAVIAVPELLFAMQGSATKSNEFIDWHFGWDARDANIFWFWLKNTGAFIPVLLFGIFLTLWRKGAEEEEEKGRKGEKEKKFEDQRPKTKDQLLFYIPFLFCFLVANVMKLAPWEWDNIKVLIYWFVGSLPFAAFALAWIYDRGKIFRVVAAGLLVVLTAAGAIDVWRVVSKQINYDVFDPDAIKIAEQIKLKTAPGALFLNAPTYNPAVVLSGRRSLMRYIGHLSSHGIDYAEREKDLQRIYEGNATSDMFLKKHGIEYVLISPAETSYLGENSIRLNEMYFKKYPVTAESGQYKVYKIK